MVKHMQESDLTQYKKPGIQELPKLRTPEAFRAVTERESRSQQSMKAGVLLGG